MKAKHFYALYADSDMFNGQELIAFTSKKDRDQFTSQYSECEAIKRSEIRKTSEYFSNHIEIWFEVLYDMNYEEHKYQPSGRYVYLQK